VRGLYLLKPGMLELRTNHDVSGELPADFVRIRTHYAGVCSTDIGYYTHGSSKLRLPVILGHEMSGIVDAVGSAVTTLQPGDAVTVMNDHHLCGTCRYCRSGDINMCMERRSIGSAADGAFADHMVVPARMVLKLPAGLPLEIGAMAEVLGCLVHGLRQAHAKAGMVVLVIGPGIMGMYAALAAKIMGCTVVLAGLDRDKERLRAAKELGIRYAVSDEQTDLAELVRSLSGGYGADIAFECAGAPRALVNCMHAAARRGYVVQVAIPKKEYRIDLSPVIQKELRYIGSYAKNREDWDIALAMLASGEVEWSRLITDIVPLESYEDAFRRTAESKYLKIMFRLAEEGKQE